jgi:hypothetical protein
MDSGYAGKLVTFQPAPADEQGLYCLEQYFKEELLPESERQRGRLK